MPFAILRIAKVKDFEQLRRLGAHEHRRQPTLNADPARSTEALIGSGDLVADVGRRIAGAGLDPSRLRRNGTLAVEVLLTASPEFFRPGRKAEAGAWDSERVAAWRAVAVDFLAAEWGANLVSAGLHLDEATPHIWAVMVPLDDTPRKRGAPVRLNASRWFDGAAKLARLQDAYAAAMAPLGIARGVRGSKAKHQDIKRFYGTIHGEAEAAERLSQRAALSLADAEIARRQTAAVANRDAKRRREAIDAAERDRAQAAAFRAGADAWAEGRILGAIGGPAAPQFAFAPMPAPEREALRRRMAPAWREIWMFVQRMTQLVEERARAAVREAVAEAAERLAVARAVFARAQTLAAELTPAARARASVLAAAINKAARSRPVRDRGLED